MEIARCLLPDIIAFCESEEGKKEFEEWKKNISISELKKQKNMRTNYEYSDGFADELN